ncbi:MAG: DUF2252 family protein [Candidatus Sericytochromatia bacterium]|nr:DUF2252 family protein [Candidatus Tanganyikabacteria bacterium]
MAVARAGQTRLSHLLRRAARPRGRVAEALYRQDRLILTKRPELAALKYRKMKEDAFSFFRGAAGLFYADLRRVEGKGFGKGPRALLAGDLHVENLGTVVKRGGKLAFGITDFDEAVLGPARLDLRRFATSLVLSGRQAGLSEKETHALVRRFGDRYRKHLAGEKATKLGGAVKKWLAEARDASAAKWLDKLAPSTGHVRRFARGETTRDVSPATRRHLERALAQYARLLPGKPLAGYSVTDAVSAVSGTASIGRGRYRLLLERPQAEPIVIEFKEMLPSVLEPFLGKQGGSPAERVVRLSRAARRRLDPYTRSVRLPASDGVGSGGFLVRRLHPGGKKAGGALVESFASFKDLVDASAARIARTHARGRRVGGASAERILADLGPADRLARDLDAFAHRYARQVEADHAAFAKIDLM